MFRNKKITRALAVILMLAMLIAPITTVSASSAGAGSSVSSSSSSTNLADLLSAVKYDEYYTKYSMVSKPATTSVTIDGEDILSYLLSATNAYDAVLKDEAGNDILDSDGNPIKKYVPTEADIVLKDKQIAIVQEIDGVKSIFLPAEGIVAWNVVVPETALYAIDMRYYSYNGADSKTTGIERTFFINGKVPFYEARFLTLSKTWIDSEDTYQLDENGNVVYKEDASGNKVPQFKTDINGNEIKPSKETVSSWTDYTFEDSTGYHMAPLEFYFEQGENVISLEAQREAMYVSSITLRPYTGLRDDYGEESDYASYIDYWESKGAEDYTGDPIKIQAEYPIATSENTLYPTNDRSSSITEPQHASKVYLNSLGGEGGEKWLTVGQWVRYEIEVPESGFYSIVLRYKQAVLEGAFSSRILRVKLPNEAQATVPFDEAQYLQFNYSDDWQKNKITNGGVEFKIYLEKGVNEIELEACFGNMTEILKEITDSLNTINDIYIKLLSITGATPDANRDYAFYDIMPDDVDELGRQAEKLYEISERFEDITGTSGSHAKTLETIARLLEKMSDSSKIARNMSNLKENLGTLGTWLQNSMQQPLQLDHIIFQNPDAKAGKATDNFFQLLWYEIRQFVASFYADYNTLGAVEEVDESNVIEVWTTLGRDQAQIIRNLITNDFNSRYEGKSVKLKLVAGGSLLPSVLAGVGPDVSLGHASGDVINWAIRSAVVGIDQFEGYDEVASWFSESAMIPLTLQELYDSDGDFATKNEEEYAAAYRFTAEDKKAYNAYVEAGGNLTLAQYAYKLAKSKSATAVVYSDIDKVSGLEKEYIYKQTVYGLPETQGFAMMFYRADVLMDLGKQPPRTWDELVALTQDLQNNHMEVALPTALGGLNMFLYQMGGELYADDGRRIGLETDVALTAFDELCKFFQAYSYPVTYSFINRFRSGEMPIGIMDYTTYTQLSVYATEIKGLWEFVPLPAYEKIDPETGKVYSNNTSVSGVAADIMLVNDERSEELTEFAWNFMKWFVSEKNQIEYANELTALLGSVSKHNTANMKALASLPWTTTEYNNLMSQFNNLSAIEEHPGGYIIGRYVNFAFLAVVNDGTPAEDAMLEYIVEINKELARKRQEFGMSYYDIKDNTSFTEEKK